MSTIDYSLWGPVFVAAIIAVALNFTFNLIIESYYRREELRLKSKLITPAEALKKLDYSLIISSVAGIIIFSLILLACVVIINSQTVSSTNIVTSVEEVSSNWAIVILTLILVCITGFYAAETQKIRKEAERMRELSNKPIFSFEIGQNPCSADTTVTQSLYLVNYGPLARDIHINTTIELDDQTRNEQERYIIAMATNYKIEILGDYCNIRRNRGKIVTKISFKDATMKTYDDEAPLIVDFNRNFDNFLTIPYSIEENDRLAIIRVLSGLGGRQR